MCCLLWRAEGGESEKKRKEKDLHLFEEDFEGLKIGHKLQASFQAFK